MNCMGAAAMVVEGGRAAVAAVMGAEQEHALERANAAIAVFETEARLAGIAYGTRALACIPADAEQTIDALSRLDDLTIVLQPDVDEPVMITRFPSPFCSIPAARC